MSRKTQKAGRLAHGLIVTLGLCIPVVPAVAYVANTGFWQIEEVPVERLLKNIEGSRKTTKAYDYWSALARLHLLAYIRDTKTLPASRHGNNPRNRQEEVVDEGPFIDCKPITPLPKRSPEKSAFRQLLR